MSDVLILNRDAQPLSLLPLSVIPWQQAMRLLSIGKVFVLEEYDDWEVHSPSMTFKVPSIIMTSEYVKYRSAAKFTKSNVFLRDEFTCQFCKKEFVPSKLTYDHVNVKSNGGGTHWENIVAACGPCNAKKGCDETVKPNRMPYKPDYWELVGKRKKYPVYISDKKWIPYLGWPDDLVILKDRNT